MVISTVRKEGEKAFKGEGIFGSLPRKIRTMLTKILSPEDSSSDSEENARIRASKKGNLQKSGREFPEALGGQEQGKKEAVKRGGGKALRKEN